MLIALIRNKRNLFVVIRSPGHQPGIDRCRREGDRRVDEIAANPEDHRTGTHRRVRLRDALAYKAEHRRLREAVLDRLSDLDQELGLI